MEIPLKDRYKSYQVKKVTPPKGSGGSGKKKERFRTPPLQYANTPTRIRVMHMEAGSGKISWRWR